MLLKHSDFLIIPQRNVLLSKYVAYLFLKKYRLKKGSSIYDYLNGIKFRGYLIQRLEIKNTFCGYLISRFGDYKIFHGYLISVKIKSQVSLNIDFSIGDRCNCYLISLLQVQICNIWVSISYFEYQEKKDLKLGRYLISRFCGFESFCGYKIYR